MSLNYQEIKIFLHPIEHPFEIDDKVIDKTAEINDWPDKQGEVINIDGSHIQVKYIIGIHILL